LINNWLHHLAQLHPLILELCAGGGDRALQAYANLSLKLQLTDRDPEALYHLPKRVGGLELDCFSLCVEEPWGRVDPATRLVVCRNGLHMMQPEQMLGMFSNVARLKVPLIILNCMDLEDPITANFNQHILPAEMQVWPRSTVLGLAAHAGLQLTQTTTFANDESCEMYGPITALALAKA
jgi:hypothetical protein